ncbi:MAG TPA: HAD hydrolase family protein [Candidatus Pacearchaeota archaeon]|nr:HAD hydrolase family protein [Candidatus Pacearchaeota archaeon]
MDITGQKLAEAKKLIKLFGLDFDGTVSDGVRYKLPEAMELFGEIISTGRSVAFITARAATAIKTLVPPMQEILAKQENPQICFVAGGNGTNLYEVKKDSLEQIYNHGMELPEIVRAVEIGKELYGKLGIINADLAQKGLDTFQKFLKDQWEGYIPSEIIDVCRPYNGELFTEEAKVTFVLPKDKNRHTQLIAELNKELGSQYQALAGDETYVHITKKSAEDSKRTAIKTILKTMGLNEQQVVTFGDMPEGNDAGLLSFPYSFTNSEAFAAKKIYSQPPYVLFDFESTPVTRVYKAIKYLIS